MGSVSPLLKARATSEPQPELVTEEGVRVAVETCPDGEVVRLRDARGVLVLEHLSATGKTILYAPDGDLELRAERGGIDLVARDHVRLRAPVIDAEGERARARFDDVALDARAITTTAETVKQVVGVLETRAARILERARDVYREVEDLAQVRAGRMRTVVRETFHLLGARVLVKGEDDVKVRGKKIHLG